MREIKFRAWDDGHMDYMTDLYWFEETGVREVVDGIGCGHYANYYIMQFTGLYDCEGVEIWEGDIIKKDSGELAVVAWDNDMASFVNEIIKPIDSNDNSYGVVIGNIHQHKHLLDGGVDSE